MCVKGNLAMSRLQRLICIIALCLQVVLLASSRDDCGMYLYAAIVVKGSDLNVFELQLQKKFVKIEEIRLLHVYFPL